MNWCRWDPFLTLSLHLYKASSKPNGRINEFFVQNSLSLSWDIQINSRLTGNLTKNCTHTDARVDPPCWQNRTHCNGDPEARRSLYRGNTYSLKDLARSNNNIIVAVTRDFPASLVCMGPEQWRFSFSFDCYSFGIFLKRRAVRFPTNYP